MATWELREAVNCTGEELPHGVDEFTHAGLARLPARTVRPVRMAGSRVQCECAYLNSARFPGVPPMGSVDVVFGRVVAVHIDDAFIDEQGRVDILKIRPIARMGCYDYTVVDNRFEMVIGGGNSALLAGLEGSAEKAAAAPPTSHTP